MPYQYHHLVSNSYEQLIEEQAWVYILNEYPQEGAREIIEKQLKNGGSCPVKEGYISLNY